MEKKNKFRFKYSPIVICLVVLVILIGLGGLALNIVSVVKGFDIQVRTTKIITTVLSSILDLALILVGISVLIFGYYKVTSKQVICRFGVFRSKYNIEEIAELTEFKKSGKLVMYFNEQKFTVVVIDKREYQAFIDAVRSVNSTLAFSLEDEVEEK